MKKIKIYEYNKEELILRDFLATDRTVLANERTFLAYCRTAISVLVSGVGFIKVFDNKLVQGIGYLFVVMSFFIMFFGVHRFITVSRKLRHIK